MIGNAKWFEIRKYGGWGVKPKTWQGWMYVTGITLPLALLLLVPYGSLNARIIASIIWVLVVCIDAMDIMIRIKRDEREQFHEALAERNATWVMTFTIACALVWQMQKGLVAGTLLVDPALIIVLVIGSLTKLFTFLYLKDK